MSPLFFPGGDIGALAVNGTVNDLAVSGARPVALSCALIIEEGLPVDTLRKVLRSMRQAADAAGVRIVTGDTKVVQRGAADKLFVNTAGIGVIPEGVEITSHGMRPGDVILVNGFLGDHGAAILVARGELALEADVPSDTAALNGLVEALTAVVRVHAMRDITRGGLAAVMNELALASEVGVCLEARAIPVRPEVAGLTEILGLDPRAPRERGQDRVRGRRGRRGARARGPPRTPARPTRRDHRALPAGAARDCHARHWIRQRAHPRHAHRRTGPADLLMHELSITRNIVAIVSERAIGKRVSSVRLVVGKLTGVDVPAVRYCFDLCTEGTPLAGARLDIDEVEGRGRCGACGIEVVLDAPLLRCGCGPDARLAVLAGEELLVRSMEVVDV